MRLTCPNCDAQYEVPEEVIPTAGRDVQCSNCGQTWFQHHPDHLEDELSDLLKEAPESDVAEEEDDPLPAPETDPPAPPRRELDPAVAEILRAEAEAEHEARKRRQRQAAPLESQPDLGLTETGAEADLDEDDDSEWDNQRRQLEARRRMAELRGTTPRRRPLETQLPNPPPRRTALPDVEEINSSLRSDTRRDRVATGGQINTLPAPRRRTGFRSGFLIILGIVLVMGLIYAFAPEIARAMPQADPALSSYVAWVDDGRVWLNGRIEALLAWFDATTARPPEAAPTTS